MKILAKLLGGFLAVALLCAVVGSVAISQVYNLQESIHNLADNAIPSLESLMTIDLELTNLKVAIRSMANDKGRGNDDYWKRQLANTEKARAAYKKALERFEALPFAPEEEKLWNAAKPLFEPAAAYNTEIIELVTKAQAADAETAARLYDQVFELIQGERRLAFDNLQTAVRKVIEYDKQYYGVEQPKAALAAAATAIAVLIAVTALAFVVAVALGLFLGRSISASLKKSVSILDRIASGDLSQRLTVKTKDEFAQVAESLNTVAQTLETFIGEMTHMSKEHDAGDIDVKIDAGKFSGSYKEMAEGVNLMVFGHIAVKKKAMACVGEFGRGNFEAPLEKFPGKKAFINETIEQVRANLKALIADADMLAQAAVEGRLQTRADSSKHFGDFRKIVDGVNRTLDLVIDPINETTAILKRMADGDLTTTMTGDYKGDFDILKTALNDTINSINDILGQVSTAVEQVTAGSQQVSQASQSLSQGATEQASSLEEITSSVTEIAGQTRQNTENAVQVNGLSRTAKEDAERGNAQMQDLVSAMSDINASAEEIRKIVKAIDDISFQINLLALNANVEAARAGKYGKGFAVVAEEVRNLAVRSAGSVKETTAMVDGTIANIGKGNALVEVTAKQLASIVDGAAKVAGLAEEVATASREQSQGLEQISTGLNQIDQVTQANTANSEESASAAEELSSQAQQLKAMIGRFKLKRQEGGGRMSNADMIAMLRAELASQGGRAAAPGGARALTLHQDDGGRKTVPAGGKTVPAAKNQPSGSGISARGGKSFVNPADVISLDDDDFGKF